VPLGPRPPGCDPARGRRGARAPVDVGGCVDRL